MNSATQSKKLVGRSPTGIWLEEELSLDYSVSMSSSSVLYGFLEQARENNSSGTSSKKRLPKREHFKLSRIWNDAVIPYKTLNLILMTNNIFVSRTVNTFKSSFFILKMQEIISQMTDLQEYKLKLHCSENICI